MSDRRQDCPLPMSYLDDNRRGVVGAKEQREGQQLVAPHTPARKWPAGWRLLLIGRQGRAQHFIHDKPDLLQSLVGAIRVELLQQEVMELWQVGHSGQNSSNQPTN